MNPGVWYLEKVPWTRRVCRIECHTDAWYHGTWTNIWVTLGDTDSTVDGSLTDSTSIPSSNPQQRCTFLIPGSPKPCRKPNDICTIFSIRPKVDVANPYHGLYNALLYGSFPTVQFDTWLDFLDHNLDTMTFYLQNPETSLYLPYLTRRQPPVNIPCWSS